MNAGHVDHLIETQLRLWLEFFTHYYYALGAALALLGFAAIGIFLMWNQARKLKRELTVAIEAVESSGTDEEGFTNNFSDVDEKLKKLPHIKRPWEEFTETLIPPLDAVDDPDYRVFRNTQRPENFFRASVTTNLIKPWLPGEILIGLGLMLTFFGLVAALTIAGPAFVDGGDIKATLGVLISTAGAKFLASIGGLLGSILIAIYQGYARNTVNRQLFKLCDLLEARLYYASAERIMADQYGHMKRQTRNLEELGNSIAVAIGDRIENAMSNMPGLLGEAMSPMAQSIDNLRDAVSDSNREGLTELVGEFKRELTGAGEESMKQMAAQLENVSTIMGTTVSSLQQTTNMLQESLTGSAQQAAAQLQQGSDAFADTLREAMAGMITGQTALQDTLNNVVDKLASGADQFDERLNKQRDQMAENMSRVVDSMNQAISQKTQQATEQMGGKINQIIESSGQQAANSLESWAGSFVEKMEAPISGIRGSLEDWSSKTSVVTQSLTQINEALDRHKQSIENSSVMLQSSGQKMAESARSVSDATQPLKTAAEAAARATQSLEHMTKESSDGLLEFSRQIGSAISENQAMLIALKSTWEEQAGQLQGADQALEQAFAQITRNLQSTLENMNHFVDKTNRSFADALQSLGGIVEGLQDAVEDLTR